MKIWLGDIPVLLILGFIVARVQAKWFLRTHPNFYFFTSAGMVGLFWINAMSSALGGRPWFGVNHTYEIPGWIALFYVLSYPMWLTFGAERAFTLFGRRPSQGGVLWPFTLKDTTKPFEPPWKS